MTNKFSVKSKVFLVTAVLLGVIFIFISLPRHYGMASVFDLFSYDAGVGVIRKRSILWMIWLVAGTVGVIYYVEKNKVKLEVLYLLMSIILAPVMSFVLPFATCPDEPHHIVYAYEVSSNLLGSSNAMRATDRAYGLDQMGNYNAITESSYTAFLDHSTKTDDVTEIPFDESDGNYIWSMSFGDRISYLLPAAVIALCRSLGLNGFWTMIVFGRWANFILYTFVIYWAIRIIPFGKLQLLVIGLLPMSLHLATSYSYDGMAISFSIFAFAAAMKLGGYSSWAELKQKEKRLMAGFAVVLFFLFFIKQHAFIFVDLFSIGVVIYGMRNHGIMVKDANAREDFSQQETPEEIRRKKRRRRKLKRMKKNSMQVFLVCLGVFLVLGFTSWRGWFSLNLPVEDNWIRDSAGTDDPLLGYTITQFLNDPFWLLYILGNTIVTNIGEFYQTCIGSRLGQLNVYTPQLTTELFTGFLLLASLRKTTQEHTENEGYFQDLVFTVTNSQKVKKEIRIAGVVLGLGTFAAIAMIMLLQWTIRGVDMIQGVQGRYLLPVLPMILLALRSERFAITGDFEGPVGCGIMVTYVYIFSSILLRF